MLAVNNNTRVTLSTCATYSLQENNACLLTRFNCAIYGCCYEKNNLCTHHFNYYRGTWFRENIIKISIKVLLAYTAQYALYGGVGVFGYCVENCSCIVTCKYVRTGFTCSTIFTCSLMRDFMVIQS